MFRNFKGMKIGSTNTAKMQCLTKEEKHFWFLKSGVPKKQGLEESGYLKGRKNEIMAKILTLVVTCSVMMLMSNPSTYSFKAPPSTRLRSLGWKIQPGLDTSIVASCGCG